MMRIGDVEVPAERLREFCQRWRIVELAVFGSALREDFRPYSDVDVLVTFQQDARWSLFDLVTMGDEIRSLVGRDVDLIEKKGLRNPFRRYEILRTRKVLYVAQPA
jgi:predicted nucleotidyltransferase